MELRIVGINLKRMKCHSAKILRVKKYIYIYFEIYVCDFEITFQFKAILFRYLLKLQLWTISFEAHKLKGVVKCIFTPRIVRPC